MWLFLSIVLVLLAAICYLLFEMRQLKKIAKATRIFIGDVKGIRPRAGALLEGVSMPLELQNVPLGESDGIVLHSKKIAVRNVTAPYNGSIIEADNGNYYLFFRYDRIDQNCPRDFYTKLGWLELDSNFNQTQQEFMPLQTGSDFSEDPRAFKVLNQVYISYNDCPLYARNRGMYLAKMDLKTRQPESIINLDFQMQSIEKNWVPFVYNEESRLPEIYFEYSQSPHKLLKLNKQEIDHLTFDPKVVYQRIYWPSIFGSIRGGTPARKIGGQYLAFFHSSFKDCDKNYWYVMGAYTFESTSPFRITAVSHYPILFKGIYDSPIMNTAQSNKRVIFPCGFVLEKKDGKNLIHLSCGENDSSIKIITLDQDKLLQSLKKI